MFTPICVSCRREMRCKKNDYLFCDYEFAAVWAGDMYECEKCYKQIVVGVAKQPLTHKNEIAFDEYAPQAHFALRRELT